MALIPLRKTSFRFPEERKPAGSPEFRYLTPLYAQTYRCPPEGTLVIRSARSPWWVVIWEPLTTKVPGPHMTRPYCCYIRTVIFYLRGYIVRPFGHLWKGKKWSWEKGGKTYEKWQEIEYTFTWGDQIEFEGETFDVGGGSVVYYNKRWWMRHLARRIKP